jgi:hypothetical protein
MLQLSNNVKFYQSIKFCQRYAYFLEFCPSYAKFFELFLVMPKLSSLPMLCQSYLNMLNFANLCNFGKIMPKLSKFCSILLIDHVFPNLCQLFQFSPKYHPIVRFCKSYAKVTKLCSNYAKLMKFC